MGGVWTCGSSTEGTGKPPHKRAGRWPRGGIPPAPGGRPESRRTSAPTALRRRFTIRTAGGLQQRQGRKGKKGRRQPRGGLRPVWTPAPWPPLASRRSRMPPKRPPGVSIRHTMPAHQMHLALMELRRKTRSRLLDRLRCLHVCLRRPGRWFRRTSAIVGHRSCFVVYEIDPRHSLYMY